MQSNLFIKFIHANGEVLLLSSSTKCEYFNLFVLTNYPCLFAEAISHL